MTDNVNITAGVGTAIATDDIGGVQYQRVKMNHGADGSATDVSTASPMPAQLRDSDGTDVALSGKLGAVDETAPASDTASSGLNGRLQRIAQRLSSIIGLLPTALGAGGGLKVDGSGTALPVSAASLPLPSGAATAAKQPALGTAGTASADVISVQGIASMTPLQIADNSGSLTVDAPVGTPVFVRLSDGSSAIATLPVSLASVPSHAVTNAGTFAVQDSQKVADDAAFTVGTSKVQPAGFLADETATDSVDEGDIGAARMTLDRKQHVVAELESASMRASGTAVTPKFAAIAASTSGNNTIVAAVSSKKIRVLAAQIIANGTVNAKWQSGASGTDLTGLAYLVANAGYVLPFNPAGWFETASNTLLNLNLSGATAVGGSITYIEV